jgi:hypothetical protein
MFKTKFRPSGMEFAACASCNNGTRLADLVAGFIARLRRGDDRTHWQIQEAIKLRDALIKKAPEVLRELFRPDKAAQTWLPTEGGVYTRNTQVTADDPVLGAYLSVFASKFGMALYREHVLEALPMHGAVLSHWFLNAGLAQKTADELLQGMPSRATLEQGKFNVGEQFSYRFNSDDRSIVAALAHFHSGLYTFTVSTSEPQRYFLPVEGGATAAIVRPGELLGRMPAREPRRVPLHRR